VHEFKPDRAIDVPASAAARIDAGSRLAIASNAWFFARFDGEFSSRSQAVPATAGLGLLGSLEAVGLLRCSRVCVPTVVIYAFEGRCALRLAHASNPENTIDEQAVDLAIARNKSFAAPPLCDRPPDATSLVSGSKSAPLSSICGVIAVLLSILGL
jgi:hypothetical protein